jgi:hypothetical protein
MAVGFPAKTNFATGEVLTATNMNDITGTLNLLQSTLYPAGRNKIINGDFGVWQRGTSFVSPANSTYTADRYDAVQNGTGTSTVSQQTFTPGTAPVSGYEGTYFLRHQVTAVGTSTANGIEQRIESVRTFAGQTVMLSFWAKADAARTISIRFDQFFGGSGGSSTVVGTTYTFNVTTAWTRFSQAVDLASIAGKTIGTAQNDAVYVKFLNANTLNSQMDLWGLQVEAASTGSTASPFQTASGSIGGELALCQRYYQFIGGTANGFPQVLSYSSGNNYYASSYSFPVEMRTSPTQVKAGTWFVSNCGQPVGEKFSPKGYSLVVLATAAGGYQFYPDSTDDIITFSAEL